MNNELIALRIIHILAGVFWAGTAVYLALILEPKLRQASDEVETAVLQQVSKLSSLWITLSAIVTIGGGFALISRTPGRSFDQLFDNGWGWAIGIGLIASLAAFFLSGWVGVNTAKLRRALLTGGGEVEQAARDLEALIDACHARIALGSRINATLVVIAVGSMASARYV